MKSNQNDLPPWLRMTPGVDPEFDELGGKLTLAQICDPLPPIHDKHSAYIRIGEYADPSLYKRDKLERQRQRLRRRLQRAARRLRSTHRSLLRSMRERLQRAAQALAMQRRIHSLAHVRTARLPTFFFVGNARCNGCIPCNGHHTPNYWGTGQADCW